MKAQAHKDAMTARDIRQMKRDAEAAEVERQRPLDRLIAPLLFTAMLTLLIRSLFLLF